MRQHGRELACALVTNALAADIEGSDGKSMSTVDKLGNIQYALHRALVDNRNFIQQDSFRAID